MDTELRESVTAVLRDMSAGDRQAADRLWPLVYDELRTMAGKILGNGRRGSLFQTTVIVHEVYLRLADRTRVDWKGRAHFFAVAAQALRRVLIDLIRHEKRVKRGGKLCRVLLENADPIAREGDYSHVELLDLHEALKRLESEHERMSRVVELRFFAGLTIEEVAAVLGVSTRLVDLDWQFARAWLYREIGANGCPAP